MSSEVGTKPLTLDRFLLARFDEGHEREESQRFPRWTVLADFESKRDIVREHVGYGGICGTCGVRAPESGERWPCRTLRLLSFPYLDHPDFRQEWAP